MERKNFSPATKLFKKVVIFLKKSNSSFDFSGFNKVRGGRVNMANIRRKMENNPAQPQYIFTEVGVGYRIVDGD